jgi:hypothetical protein
MPGEALGKMPGTLIKNVQSLKTKISGLLRIANILEF